VDYEWDESKARANLRDHSIDFADAATVFDDDLALTVPNDTAPEERYDTLGMDAMGRLLVVVYTWRGDRIRIISARKATETEHRNYDKVR
jgi:uncharacterized DUF497 family protein